ncbi:hypothetical protein [Neptuniibacter sp. QD48_11]|uniref:hypothetical protein n=1 Tax=unclassified Neptuniibacter TaxID=2630693 RepID=UPI0039F57105
MKKFITGIVITFLSVSLPLTVAHADPKNKADREAAKEQRKNERESMKRDEELLRKQRKRDLEDEREASERDGRT